MLSYKSDTFQTARKDLDELNKAFQQAGNKLGVDDVEIKLILSVVTASF